MIRAKAAIVAPQSVYLLEAPDAAAALLAFDGPTREKCTVRRPRTNTQCRRWCCS